MSISAHPQPAVSDTDRNYALGIHLSPLAGLVFGPAILAPLVLWIMRKDESEFVDDHGREMINALLSFLLYHVIAVVTVIGLVVLPVLYIVGIISVVRGAIASGRGEFFRYPMTLRFLG